MNAKRLLYSVLSTVMFISGAVLLFYFFWANGYIDMPSVIPVETEDDVDYTTPSLPSSIEPSTNHTESGNEGTVETTNNFEPDNKYTNIIDFDSLKKSNDEIVGWIYMTSPSVNAPVLMSKNDDAFYLSHGPNAKYSKRGSFYIENSYNHDDFEDPVTIIYGHRKSDGSMFGKLQSTLDKIDINKDPQYVVIYLPESTKIFHIVATYRHDSSHVLYYNNFNKQESYDKFFDMVFSSKGSGVQLVQEDKPRFGDKVLILSTCFKGDRTNRYLVIAKELK